MSDFMLGFGIGGKTCPSQENASDIFSLSGNMFNPIIENSEIIDKYSEAFSRIKLSLPINYSPIFSMMADYAKYEKQSMNNDLYFSLIYITPCVADDLEDILIEFKNSVNLPLATTVIKVNNDNLKNNNNYEEMKSDLEAYDANLINFIDFEAFKANQEFETFQKLLVRNIPEKVKKYFTHYQITPDWVSTQDQINLSHFSDSSKYEGSKTSKWSEQDDFEEEKVISKSERPKDIISTIIMTTSNETKLSDSNDGSQGNWFRGNKWLPYSAVLEEQFLKKAKSNYDDYKFNEIETLVRQGSVFDTNNEFISHLLNSDNEQGN